MSHLEDLAGVFAVVLSLSIPIVAIVMSMIKDIKKKKSETELRLALIQAGTDAETAKILIEEQLKKHNKYSGLRWGCILIGMGLGAVCNFIIDINPEHNIYFWFIIAAGMGIGLLTSFVIEYNLTKKEEKDCKNKL
ncbi:MAG: hypothetical protein J5486_07360 [Bacteroidaceae bacterium]|nr:hypothetical protein [Bacteroidaceae bacterium]